MNIISGKVIHGEHYGKTLGFPTANLDRRDYSRRKLKIKLGIYSGYAGILFTNHYSLITKRYKAGIVIGPLDKKGLPKIEAHLFGFRGKLYGKRITLRLVKYLRPFKKFQNESVLKAQIEKDIKIIKKLTFYG